MMKPLLIASLAAALAGAQAPPLTPGAPLAGAPAVAASPVKLVAPDAVVAEVDGKKYTAAEADQLMKLVS